MAQLLRARQPSRILHMAAIDHIGKRADALPRIVLEPHRAHHLAIDGGHLLARTQIGDRLPAVFCGHAERDAAADAAAIEPEHQSRFFRRTAMDEGIDAEGAMLADQPRRNPLDEFETGPPYQRAIAEHPEVAFGKFCFWEGDV